MTTKVKRKVKLKKKNFIIFILFIIFFSFAIYEMGYVIIKVITTSDKNIELKDEKKDKKVKKSKKENNSSEYNQKLEKLDYVNKKVDYFRDENIDRYINYKEKNENLDNVQIIKNVNMNMDLTHYEDKIPAINIGKNTILVNKYYYLEDNYVPNNLEKVNSRFALSGIKLVRQAKEHFEELASAAENEGLKIVAMSAYRSYDYQVNLYNRYKREDGIKKADTYSGRPGHSEHQTGLATDVYNQKENYTDFEQTKEFKWMMKHAHEYGFILRFPKDKENETGYIYESWHYRYVGKEIAKYIKDNNISFEEYIATRKEISS